jgi:hypothetical protein
MKILLKKVKYVKEYTKASSLAIGHWSTLLQTVKLKKSYRTHYVLGQQISIIILFSYLQGIQWVQAESYRINI